MRFFLFYLRRERIFFLSRFDLLSHTVKMGLASVCVLLVSISLTFTCGQIFAKVEFFLALCDVEMVKQNICCFLHVFLEFLPLQQAALSRFWVLFKQATRNEKNFFLHLTHEFTSILRRCRFPFVCLHFGDGVYRSNSISGETLINEINFNACALNNNQIGLEFFHRVQCGWK